MVKDKTTSVENKCQLTHTTLHFCVCVFETIHNDAYTCFHCQAASATADKHSGKTAGLNRRKPILPNRKFVAVFSDFCQNLIYRARSTYRLTDRFKCSMCVVYDSPS